MEYFIVNGKIFKLNDTTQELSFLDNFKIKYSFFYKITKIILSLKILRFFLLQNNIIFIYVNY